MIFIVSFQKPKNKTDKGTDNHHYNDDNYHGICV